MEQLYICHPMMKGQGECFDQKGEVCYDNTCEKKLAGIQMYRVW